nr:MAG TPA: hypothetical protein [Caudoviricetes sp.]
MRYAVIVFNISFIRFISVFIKHHCHVDDAKLCLIWEISNFFGKNFRRFF